MMSDFRAVIDDVLSRTDIAEFIGRYVKLQRAGHSYKGLCPFHEEKTPSFHVVPDKQFFHCFGCGTSGDAIEFVRRYHNVEFYPALLEVAKVQGIALPDTLTKDTRSPEEKDRWQQSLDLLQQAADFYRAMLKSHQYANRAQVYLKKRHLEDATVERFAIGFAPPERNALCRLWSSDSKKTQLGIELGLIKQNDRGESYDQFRNRIIFPIRDSRGRVRGFGGRAIDADQQPKYLNSSESDMFHKAAMLYGLYESLEHRTQEQSWLVVEGYMDVVALQQHGFQRVIACLGTAINPQQIQWLGRYHNTLCFAFDGDAAGKRAAEKTMHICLPLVSDERAYHFAFLPEGEDPDSLVTNQGADAMRQLSGVDSIPLSDMFVRWLQQQGSIDTVEGKSRIASIAKKEMAQLPTGHFRKLMEQRIRDLTYINYRRFHSRKQQAPSVKGKTKAPENQAMLLHFLAAVSHNPVAFAESQPPMIEQLRLLASYIDHLPIDFFERIVHEPENIMLIMFDALPAEQLEELKNYRNNNPEQPGVVDMNRLFTGLRKYCYNTMNNTQKSTYMQSLNSVHAIPDNEA